MTREDRIYSAFKRAITPKSKWSRNDYRDKGDKMSSKASDYWDKYLDADNDIKAKKYKALYALHSKKADEHWAKAGYSQQKMNPFY